jgi:response regulator RpfG family c-di-GMP phosphodiesterase
MQEVITYLRDQAGKQFDPAVVEEFIHMLEEDSADGPY